MSKKYKILLVDDEPGILKMVTKRLEFEGYDVACAVDGEEALKKIKTEDPDLIILDIMLPKMDGYEVCRRFKEDSSHRKVPVILFTAMVQQKNKQMGFQCGADAYVCKPFRTHELLGKIKELLPKEGG